MQCCCHPQRRSTTAQGRSDVSRLSSLPPSPPPHLLSADALIAVSNLLAACCVQRANMLTIACTSSAAAATTDIVNAIYKLPKITTATLQHVIISTKALATGWYHNVMPTKQQASPPWPTMRCCSQTDTLYYGLCTQHPGYPWCPPNTVLR